MKETLNLATEIDFVSCGFKPRGELFLRASKLLLDTEKLKTKLSQSREFKLEVAFKLIQRYVLCQKNKFHPNEVKTDDWIIKKKVQVIMNTPCLLNPLQEAFKFKDKIENAADGSELCAVALGIIHEYENYCSQKAEIAKYVKAQRKIINSTRKMFFAVLEKRDGLVCKICGSVENLQIDHKKPLSLGGSSALENLQLLCGFCNASKNNR